MRQLIVFALSRIRSLKVVEADDGVDALRKLPLQHFDVMIIDINMPVMDGLKLVSMVRKDQVHKDIPIIIITTEGAQADRHRALSLGGQRLHHQTDPGAPGHLQGQGTAEADLSTLIGGQGHSLASTAMRTMSCHVPS